MPLRAIALAVVAAVAAAAMAIPAVGHADNAPTQNHAGGPRQLCC